MTLIERNDRFAAYFAGTDFVPRIASRVREDGGIQEYIRGELGEWCAGDVISAEDVLSTGIAGMDATGETLYRIDSRGRNTSALTALKLADGSSKVLAQDERVDVEGVLFHPAAYTPQALSFNLDRRRWVVLDPEIEPDIDYLSGVASGDLAILSRTLDDRYWMACYQLDDAASRFYLYDRARRVATFLFVDRSRLAGKRLARMLPATIRSRDGLDLPAYYSLPPESDTDGDGIPDSPLPTVFVPHGGPWARDHWGYNAWHQWLANRGYAVLCVNFRASTGFGKAHVNAGDREWGGKIIDDQVDTVRWAIGTGIADSARIAIMGASFGGYSTLAGLAFAPDLFACGVDMVGIADLAAWIEAVPPYWKPMMDMLIQRVGDPYTAEGRAILAAHSPIAHVDAIRRPLLIAHGANDARVKQAESDRIVAALREKGQPVVYLLYPDEGHGIDRSENKKSFHAIAEAFLARYLGGKCEPIGDDMENSSVKMLAGLDPAIALDPSLVNSG
jgi:dipeptidyl aminopeptidase/acylaminoacyl peptidase